jgi:hypothetical protein
MNSNPSTAGADPHHWYLHGPTMRATRALQVTPCKHQGWDPAAPAILGLVHGLSCLWLWFSSARRRAKTTTPIHPLP